MRLRSQAFRALQRLGLDFSLPLMTLFRMSAASCRASRSAVLLSTIFPLGGIPAIRQKQTPKHHHAGYHAGYQKLWRLVMVSMVRLKSQPMWY
jgi:hypothetical protein